MAAMRAQSGPALYSETLLFTRGLAKLAGGMIETMTPKQCSSFVHGEEKRYLVLMLTEPWTKVLILRFPPAGPSH